MSRVRYRHALHSLCSQIRQKTYKLRNAALKNSIAAQNQQLRNKIQKIMFRIIRSLLRLMYFTRRRMQIKSLFTVNLMIKHLNQTRNRLLMNFRQTLLLIRVKTVVLTALMIKIISHNHLRNLLKKNIHKTWKSQKMKAQELKKLQIVKNLLVDYLKSMMTIQERARRAS